jgi:hypothetical protein
MRSASVTTELRRESGVALSKSARTTRSPSEINPWAARDPTGPIPVDHMTKYPTTATPRSAKAPIPPATALRQVKRWCRVVRGCVGVWGEPESAPLPAPEGSSDTESEVVASDGDSTSTAPAPVPTARAPSGAVLRGPAWESPGDPSRCSDPVIPSCTMAVARTTGSPMMRRIRAKGGTQSGSPAFSVTPSTTWREPQDPTR